MAIQTASCQGRITLESYPKDWSCAGASLHPGLRQIQHFRETLREANLERESLRASQIFLHTMTPLEKSIHHKARILGWDNICASDILLFQCYIMIGVVELTNDPLIQQPKEAIVENFRERLEDLSPAIQKRLYDGISAKAQEEGKETSEKDYGKEHCFIDFNRFIEVVSSFDIVQNRAHLLKIRASLVPNPLYSQIPTLATISESTSFEDLLCR